MYEDHELVKTVFAALDNNAGSKTRAEALAQCLQVRRVGSDVVSFLRQELAKITGGAAADGKLSDLVTAGLRGDIKTRAIAFIAALNADQDSDEVNKLVHEVLNPLRGGERAESKTTEG